MKVALFCSSLFLLGNCQEKLPNTSFVLNDESMISIVNQTNDSLRVASEGWTIVPFKEQILDTVIGPSTIFTYRLKTQGKKHYNLELNQTKYRLFTQPQANDTVVFQPSSGSDSIMFTGDSQQVNRFLLKKQIAVGSADADWMPRTNITRRAGNFSELATANDSITRIHQIFLEQHAPTLPSAYVAFETERLKYLNAGFTSNSSFYRSVFLGRTDTIPTDFLDNLEEVQNTDMLGSLQYY